MSRPPRRRHRLTLAFALVGALFAVGTLAACGTGRRPADGRLHVVTSFYPLQFVATRIGGDRAVVSSLTRPGAEPHDLELTPRDVAQLQDADLVVYLRGFQPAVDQAVDEHTKGQPVVNVAPTAHLEQVESTSDAQLADEHLASEGGTDGAVDPHFWLDPTRLAAVTTEVAAQMGRAAPSDAGEFNRRAAALVDELTTLDHEFRAGLQHCTSRDLVTSHSAFGYLAQRYGLHQVGITGLTPESEPDPRSLARVASYVRRHHVTTIYSETLVSPAVARTVARETGAKTAVLDPLEGIDDSSAGHDYLGVMRSNLEVLREGQSCS